MHQNNNQSHGTLTRQMNTLKDDIDRELRSLYPREDLEREFITIVSDIISYKKAGNTSGIKSQIRDLYRLLDRHCIPYERGKKMPYYYNLIQNSGLLSRDDHIGLENRLISILLQRYREYPDPTRFMEQLVRKLSGETIDHQTGETLRLVILKRFIAYGDYLEAAGFGGKQFIQDSIRNASGYDGEMTQEFVLDNLSDSIFKDADAFREDTEQRYKARIGLLEEEIKTNRILRDGKDNKSCNTLQNSADAPDDEADLNNVDWQDTLDDEADLNNVDLQDALDDEEDLNDVDIQTGRELSPAEKISRITKKLKVLDVLRKKNTDLQAGAQKNIKKCNSKIDSAKAKIREEEKKKAETIKIYDSLAEKLEMAKNNPQISEKERKKAETDCIDIKRQLSRCQNKIENACASIKENKSKICNNQNLYSQVQENLDKLNAAISRRKSILCTVKQEKETKKRQLKEINKTIRRLVSEKCGLIILADDLAGGKFRWHGTRRGLYLFAIVFDMKYISDGISAQIDASGGKDYKDIEKNIFQDYFTNNLIRYLSDAYIRKATAFEEPTGQGINYKNYEEIVYLYYLQQDMRPQEKIQRAEAMIARLHEASTTSQENDAEEKDTEIYQQNFMNQVLAITDDDALFHYMVKHYDLNKLNGINETAVSRKQISASKEYENILKLLNEDYEKTILTHDNEYIASLDNEHNKELTASDKKELLPQNQVYSLSFTKDAGFRNRLITDILPLVQPSVSEETADDFLLLLKNFSRYLGKNTLPAPSPEKITRTMLLSAFNRYLIATTDNSKIPSFNSFFKMYESKVRTYLEKSYYQPLSPKNIFDMLIVFSSYYNIYYG